MSADVLLGILGITNLSIAVATLVVAIRWKRGVIVLWGILTIATSVPFALAFAGVDVDEPSLVALNAVTVIRSVAVLAAAISSDSEVRRLREILAAAGIEPDERRWRP